MIPPLNRRRPGQFRLPIRVPAVTEAIGACPVCRRGEAQDLSPGGALLCLEQGIPPGTPVRVTLRLSRRPPLTLIGTVVWTRPHSDIPGWALGIRFDADLPGEMVAEIADAEFPPWTSSPRAMDPPAPS